jgi:WhiB family transcriptional regulator, redox-sensing transcriptional regulator
MPGGSQLEVRLGPWMDLAACRGMVTSADEDIFFTPELDELGGNRRAATRMAATRERQALAVCDRCPVQVACLAYAVTTRQQHGVWGGKTQQELRRLVANTDRPRRCPPIDVGGPAWTSAWIRRSLPGGTSIRGNQHLPVRQQAGVSDLPAGPSPRPTPGWLNALSSRTSVRPGQHRL